MNIQSPILIGSTFISPDENPDHGVFLSSNGAGSLLLIRDKEGHPAQAQVGRLHCTGDVFAYGSVCGGDGKSGIRFTDAKSFSFIDAGGIEIAKLSPAGLVVH